MSHSAPDRSCHLRIHDICQRVSQFLKGLSGDKNKKAIENKDLSDFFV